MPKETEFKEIYDKFMDYQQSVHLKNKKKIDFGNLKERISNTKKMYIAVLVGLDVSLFDIYDMIESIHDGLDCEILVMPAPDDKLNDNEIKVSVFYKDWYLFNNLIKFLKLVKVLIVLEIEIHHINVVN